MSQPPAPGAIASQGPSALPPGRLPQWPVRRKKQAFVIPIIAIVIGALVMMLLILLQVVFTPVTGILGLTLSAATSIVLILLLGWLDRWEPEPPHLLLAGFFWGGGVALLMVFIGSPLLELFGGDGEFFTAVISAPLVEETAKGLFFLVVLLAGRRGRAEFNSLTDALVYAGFVGIGFAFVEHMSYIASGQSLADALAIAALRLGLGAWTHAIYVAMTAIGLWLGVNSRGAMRFVYPFLGWCVAVLLHAMNNGSTFLGPGAFFLNRLLFTLPALIVLVVIAVRSNRREGEIFRSQLPVMVYNGWVTPQEAAWLDNLRSRKQALAYAKTQGRHERQRLAAFRDHVTELAFVRHRLDRLGPPFPPDLVRQHDDLVELLVSEKQWVAEQLQPPRPAWQPVHPVPGQDYVQPSFGSPGQPPVDPQATRLR